MFAGGIVLVRRAWSKGGGAARAAPRRALAPAPSRGLCSPPGVAAAAPEAAVSAGAKAAPKPKSEPFKWYTYLGGAVVAVAVMGAGPIAFGLGPVGTAALTDQVWAVRMLIDRGYSVGPIHVNGPSPIGAASLRGSSELVAMLIEAGADPNTRDPDGFTPLHNASMRGHEGAVVALLRGGAHPGMREREGRTTPLHQAALGRHRAVAAALLAAGAPPSGASLAGTTPLHHAARVGDAGMVELLIQHGADPRAKRTLQEVAMFWRRNGVTDPAGVEGQVEGSTPLHLACEQGHVKVAEVLLAAGADPFAANGDGWTPLHEAAHGGHGEAVALLAPPGPAGGRGGGGWWPWARAGRGGRLVGVPEALHRRTALHVACGKGHAAAARALLAAGADPGARAERGMTPVHYAAMYGHEEVLGDLLARGGPTDLREEALGRTPLHLAAAKGHAGCVKALVGAGADPHAKSRGGDTPLTLAVSARVAGGGKENEDDDTIRALRAAGAGK